MVKKCHNIAFFITLILEAMKEPKLPNDDNYIIFNVSPDAIKNRIAQGQSIGRSKWANNEVAPMLYIFVPSYLWQLLRCHLEGTKFIEFIYSKNNNYLLLNRVYEDDKTLALTKFHSFCLASVAKYFKKM